MSWNLGQLSTWLCDKVLVCRSRPGFRVHTVERCTLYVWMPSTCSLGDLKLIHVSVKDPRRTLRSRGESSYVQPQRNMEVKTINYVGMPSNPWRDLLRIGCVKAFSQSILVRALIKFFVWFGLVLPGLTESDLGSLVSGASMSLVQLPIKRVGKGPERPFWQKLSSSTSPDQDAGQLVKCFLQGVVPRRSDSCVCHSSFEVYVNSDTLLKKNNSAPQCMKWTKVKLFS